MSLCLEDITLDEEENLCFRDAERTKEYGCIGYLRGDFGDGGREFWTTWFPQNSEELNDEKFKIVFDAVINRLREP